MKSRRGLWAIIAVLLIAMPLIAQQVVIRNNGGNDTLDVTNGRAQVDTPPLGPIITGVVSTPMTGTTSTQVTTAFGGNYQYITWCIVSNAHASVGTDIILQDGSGGTTLATLPDPTSGSATGVSGGMFPLPTPIKVSLGNALYAANVTTGSSTKITCGGYRSTKSY